MGARDWSLGGYAPSLVHSTLARKTEAVKQFIETQFSDSGCLKYYKKLNEVVYFLGYSITGIVHTGICV